MIKFVVICTILLGLCFLSAESFLNPAVAQWGEWGSEQCSIVAGRCILSRSRNCSAKNMQECIVRGGNEYTVNIWTDMTTCRCRIEESTTSSTSLVPSTTPSSHWLEWGTWECHLMNGECTQLRWRKCSGSGNECKGSDYSIKHCDGLICGVRGTSTSMPTTLSITLSSLISNNSFTSTQSLRSSRATMSSTNLQYFISSTSSSLYWLEWSDWDCKNFPICLMSRTRNCSRYEPSDCERKLSGPHYEIQPCRGEICPDVTTIGSTVIAAWSNWGSWECHYEQSLCVMARYRTCLGNRANHHCPGQDYELRSCDNTCSVVTTTGSPVIALWSNWSSWECNHDEQGLCVMTRYRTCLYNKTGKHCHGEDFEIRSCANACSAWSDWICSMETYGVCKALRTRKCSTVCGNETSQTKSCDNIVCPDLFQIQQSGRCGNFSAIQCTDNVAACSSIQTMHSKSCVFKDVASKLCPKTCGCCQDLYQTQPSQICTGFNTTTCSDHVSCSTIPDMHSKSCFFKDVAVKLCPTTCGCCH